MRRFLVTIDDDPVSFPVEAHGVAAVASTILRDPERFALGAGERRSIVRITNAQTLVVRCYRLAGDRYSRTLIEMKPSTAPSKKAA